MYVSPRKNVVHSYTYINTWDISGFVRLFLILTVVKDGGGFCQLQRSTMKSEDKETLDLIWSPYVQPCSRYHDISNHLSTVWFPPHKGKKNISQQEECVVGTPYECTTGDMNHVTRVPFSLGAE